MHPGTCRRDTWRLVISERSAQVASAGRDHREPSLELCVGHILKSEGVPAFCKNANEVMLKALDFDGSGKEMAQLILKDLGLTSQILRLVNSAMFNRSGHPILSVAHAITLLGWDRVRNLVSMVRFVEHFMERSAGVRELMLLSVLTAVHCRDVASVSGYPRREEAYIFGLFRNLGEVLIACHYPFEYAQALLAMETEKIPPTAACQRIFGFRWDQVGSKVVDAWNMPTPVRSTMAGLERARSALDRSACSIADYARDLTHAIYREGAGVESVQLRCVIDADDKQALVSVRDLRGIVDAAVAETEATFTALGVPTAQLRLEEQTQKARLILARFQVFTAAILATLDQAIDHAARALRQPDLELTGFVTRLLDAIRDAGFQRVVFGLLNEDHTLIRGRLASGQDQNDILDRFQFPLDGSDGAVLAALGRRTDVLVDRDRDERYEGSLLVARLGPTAFAMFPILVDGHATGCLYADRLTASPGLEMARPSLARARDAIAAGIRRIASRSPNADHGASRR